MMWQQAADVLCFISSSRVALSEAAAARRSTSGPIFRRAPTGERLIIAPAAHLEGLGAISMPASPSLPACFASLDALSRASHRVFSSSLHRRVSAASNAFCNPKTEKTAPRVAPIDLLTSRTPICSVGDEEGASTDDRLDGLVCGGGSGRVRRL